MEPKQQTTRAGKVVNFGEIYGAGATDNDGGVKLCTLGKSLEKFGAVEIELVVVNWEGGCQ